MEIHQALCMHFFDGQEDPGSYRATYFSSTLLLLKQDLIFHKEKVAQPWSNEKSQRVQTFAPVRTIRLTL